MSHKTLKSSGFHEGDVTIVKIGDRKFPTIIIDGVQCFQADTVTVALYDAMIAGHSAWWRTNNDAPQPYNLNSLSVEYSQGKHTLDSMLTFYANIGYSVRELTYLSEFYGLDIRNPLWEYNHYARLSNQAWAELMGLIGHEYQHNGNESVRYLFDVERDGKWRTEEGCFVAKSETIDRIVLAYLKKYSISVEDIEVEDDTCDELKAFMKHLKN